MAGMEMQQKLI